ncbi:hypothetical protein [Enterocloster clostridioformis]|uniref:Uncharacterized protein n=1 Tax=Enterocloster clostridioformis TaxID=1531 RepID=A0AAP9LWF4_9FIRM|nr:hypothetical protein [Enterocloster clostridioformis]EHG33266.1 hypothetical protein HMPREF9467_00877 [ [[Clostridium] clostridioforme 2_1_49FAA]ENZ28620.1 hypothetical protein HMPREF1087_01113 [[Clostridium] clostridioforme 90A1]ENZ73449.1 hypothetical protein HMPREF1081_00058 [[Clostridium] clostridioforme 90A4]QIX89190.1 hypothetical protein FOC47_00475 [Enterocloster clostridioformis]
MLLDKITENKIREHFRSYDFQNFMFEMLIGDSRDENGELIKHVYKHELEETEDELIYLIQAHVNHNIPLNRYSIISFVLRHVVENLLGDDLNCHCIKFYALCNQLYYMVFEEIRKYYKPFMLKENT